MLRYRQDLIGLPAQVNNITLTSHCIVLRALSQAVQPHVVFERTTSRRSWCYRPDMQRMDERRGTSWDGENKDDSRIMLHVSC